MIRPTSPGLHLMRSWLLRQPWIPSFIWRLPPRVRGALIVAAILLVVYWGAAGSRLHSIPDRETLIDVFFRGVFVPFIILMIAWYIASLKLVPARANEYLYLNSLPLSNGGMHRLFLYSGLSRFQWVPIGMAVLLSSLAVAAPVSFLIRLNALVLAAYVLLQTAGIAVHLAVSLKGAGEKRAGFPAKSNPLIQLGVVIACSAMPVVWILYPGQISGGSFSVVAVSFEQSAISLFAVSKRIFEKWRAMNVIFKSIVTPDGGPRMGYGAWARVIGKALMPFKSNPLLIKNLVRSGRETSLSSRFALGLFFVAISFLIAMNNESISDAVTALSWMFYLYALFVVMRGTDWLGADEEPPELLYSIPVTKVQLYISVFVPVIAWLTGIALVQSILVALAGGGVALTARFLSMSLLVSLVFCGIGASSAVSGYPNRKETLKRFLGGMLVLAVLSIILYEYRFAVMAAVASVWLLLPLRKRLYRT